MSLTSNIGRGGDVNTSHAELQLRESHRNNQGRREGSPIAVDDIVLVYNEHQPRGFWKLARVKETIVGKDGRVRGAVLKLPAKDGRTTLLRRLL